MRVLAHIHTFNDADVIERVITALEHQTRRPDAIVIVDNGSTDATLDRTFPECVTVIRNSDNLGTSGAVRVGFAYALEHAFDWTWVFDADSVPEANVLEDLLGLFFGMSPSAQKKVCFLACRVAARMGQARHEPMMFTASGGIIATAEQGGGYSRCDCALWSGSLYRMAAVAKIGLPQADYVLDWGELEYGYRAQQLGFASFMVHNCVLHHDTGGISGLAPRIGRFGPIRFPLYELSPIRCYYQVRNSIYFWLYQFHRPRLNRAVRNVVRSLAFTMTFAIQPFSHFRQLVACLRGLWHGLTGNIAARY
jgi:GT2 family glycosyltransferase